jgi:hypothetical protein
MDHRERTKDVCIIAIAWLMAVAVVYLVILKIKILLR